MVITFDPLKDKLNRRKHGISLRRAADLDWQAALIWPDERNDYREDRYSGLGILAGRLYCVVFVERDNGLRIVSLRKANRREVVRYEKQT
ncbi:MAG: BrnT family toxin [Sphingomonadaceae bacterium]